MLTVVNNPGREAIENVHFKGRFAPGEAIGENYSLT